MSFHEKSAWAMLIALLAVYGAYFFTAWSWGGFSGGDLPAAALTPLLFGTVVGLIVIAAVAHFAIWVFAPKEAGVDVDASDERDRAFERRGEALGGMVLGCGVLLGVVLAMIEAPYFVIANALLATLVLSEAASLVTRIVSYRRGA